MVQLRIMELEERKRADAERTRKQKVVISLTFAVIGILMMIGGMMAGEATGNPDSALYMISMAGMFALMAAAWIWIYSKK